MKTEVCVLFLFAMLVTGLPTTLRVCNLNPVSGTARIKIINAESIPLGYKQCDTLNVEEGKNMPVTVLNAEGKTLQSTSLAELCPKAFDKLNNLFLLRGADKLKNMYQVDLPTKTAAPCAVDATRVRHFYANYAVLKVFFSVAFLVFPIPFLQTARLIALSANSRFAQGNGTSTSVNFFADATKLSATPLGFGQASLMDSNANGVGTLIFFLCLGFFPPFGSTTTKFVYSPLFSPTGPLAE
jgi:hypothetical protein